MIIKDASRVFYVVITSSFLTAIFLCQVQIQTKKKIKECNDDLLFSLTGPGFNIIIYINEYKLPITGFYKVSVHI